MPHPSLTLNDAQLRAECLLQQTRRSGPGGQHRNKVATAVVLQHRPTGLRAEAAERRSQVQNLQQALHRLRLQIAMQVRADVDLDHFQPDTVWASRSIGGRLTVSLSHRDYPAMVAEALDVLQASDDSPADAARRLGCTTSQLIRLLRREPLVWQAVNRDRQARGLERLK